jgi:hypothetical protein
MLDLILSIVYLIIGAFSMIYSMSKIFDSIYTVIWASILFVIGLTFYIVGFIGIVVSIDILIK